MLSSPGLKNFDNYGADFRDMQNSYFSYEKLKGIIDAVKEKMRSPSEGSRSKKEQELTKQLLLRLLAEKEKFGQVFVTEKGSTYFILQSGESFRIKREDPNEFQKEYDIQPITRKIFFVTPEDWQPLFQLIKHRRPQYTRFIGDASSPEEEQAFQYRKAIYERLKGGKIDDYDFKRIDIRRSGMEILIGEPIPTTGLKAGVIPLEFDFAEERGDENIYEMEGRNLILKGHKKAGRNGEEFIYPEGLGITHYGLPVRKVLRLAPTEQ